MIWLGILLLVVLVCFSGVLLFGAPYLPTMRRQIEVALDLADLKTGQTILELGCGDGKVLIAAAGRGINSVGYELNPLLVVIAWLRTRKYRKNVKIIWGDYWTKPWPEHQAIFTFLLPRLMPKLNTKITHSQNKPVKLISFAFTIPKRKIDAQNDSVFLYIYK